MAGFAEGMATTSGWALVRRDCIIRIQQDSTLMYRSRMMKMAAAACYGGDVQDRIEESITQDSADGNDSSYFFESLIFPVFSGCSSVQNLQAPKGLWTASKALKLHASAYHRESGTVTMSLLVLKHYMFRRGCVWKCEHVLWTPCWFSSPGALTAPKGKWPYTEATPIGAATTSPPEGVFRHKRRIELVELSAQFRDAPQANLDTHGRLQPTPSEGRQRGTRRREQRAH